MSLWACAACGTAFYGLYYLWLRQAGYVELENQENTWAGPPTSWLQSSITLTHFEHWLIGLICTMTMLGVYSLCELKRQRI